MIINYDSPGQLCNRIWSIVPSVAYGLEYNEKVLIINFDEYSSGFENLNSNDLVTFASKRLFKKFIHSIKVRGFIQNGKPNIFSRLFKWNLIEGWPNRLGNTGMVQDQAEKIRDIFRFKKEITDPVDNIMSSCSSDIIVGIHIRRGDYKEWLDGIYYYADEDYYYVMKTINEQLNRQGKNAKFLLCSNESIDISRFSGVDCFVIPQSSGIQDLYALSRCAYIAGPPSTYSQWASFMGKVPVKYIMSINEKILLQDFSRIISFNKFEDGNVLILD